MVVLECASSLLEELMPHFPDMASCHCIVNLLWTPDSANASRECFDHYGVQLALIELIYNGRTKIHTVAVRNRDAETWLMKGVGTIWKTWDKEAEWQTVGDGVPDKYRTAENDLGSKSEAASEDTSDGKTALELDSTSDRWEEIDEQSDSD